MIQNIQIKNFKLLKGCNLPLSHLTLLTGVNGMGKSTLIQALLLFRQTYQKIGHLNEGLLLRGDLIDLGTTADILCDTAINDEINFSFDMEENNHSLKYTLIQQQEKAGNKRGEFFYLNPEQEKSFLINLSPQELANYPLFNAHFQYISAARIIPQTSYTSSERDVEKKWIGKQGEFLIHYLHTNKNKYIQNACLALVEDEKNKALPLIDQVSAWLSFISPNVFVKTQYLPETDSYSLGYEFSTNGSIGKTKTFKAINAAFGLTYVLPVITALLIAEKGDLVIIENPESDLHPQGQAKLGEMMAIAAEGGVQLIIETHSDHILNGIRVAIKKFHKGETSKGISTEKVKTYYFKRNEQEHIADIIPIIIDENGDLNKQPDGFMDEWGNLLYELLD